VVLIKTGVDAVVREGGPMLTVVQDADEANGNEAGQRSLLDEIERDGASQMLTAASQAEVAAWQAEVAAYCGRCGRGHRATGQRRVDPETDGRQGFT
jgi:hypothetical protein